MATNGGDSLSLPGWALLACHVKVLLTKQVFARRNTGRDRTWEAFDLKQNQFLSTIYQDIWI